MAFVERGYGCYPGAAPYLKNVKIQSQKWLLQRIKTDSGVVLSPSFQAGIGTVVCILDDKMLSEKPFFQEKKHRSPQWCQCVRGLFCKRTHKTQSLILL